MSPEEERKHGFIAYGLVAGMIAMLAIVYPLTWAHGSPDLYIFLVGLAGGSGIGFAVYRRTRRCPVCRSHDCDPTCPICGRDRDEEHARYRGNTILCSCHETRREAGRAANDDRAASELSSGDFGGMSGLGP